MDEPDFAFSSRATPREIELLYRIAQELLSSERHLGPILKAHPVAHGAGGGHGARNDHRARPFARPGAGRRRARAVGRAAGARSLPARRRRDRQGARSRRAGHRAQHRRRAAVPRSHRIARATSTAPRSPSCACPSPIAARSIGTLSVDRVYGAEVSLEDDLRLLMIVAMMIGQSVRQRRDQVEEVDSLKRETQRLAAQQRAAAPRPA